METVTENKAAGTYESTLLKGEETFCQKHSKWFLKIYAKSLEVWTGECPKCSEDQALERRAIAKLSSNEPEILARLAAKMKREEGEIEKQIEAELASYIEEIRPAFCEDVRERWGDALRGEVESEMVSEIVAKLKAEKAN